MNKTVLKIIAGAVLLINITNVNAQPFSARQGDLWLGGGIEFSSYGTKLNDYQDANFPRKNLLLLSPIIRFFPANNIVFGPKISWTGMYYDEISMNVLGLGGEIGYVGNSRVSPYFLVSPHLTATMFDDYSSNMFMLPFTVGTITPIMENVGIQLEVGYTLGFHEYFSTNTFSVAVGICGLGERVAISLVNTVATLNQYF